MYPTSNYSYYPQNNQNQTQNFRYPTYQPQGLKGRPVSSLEEVRAQTIDFDGSVFYFPDIANKRIYTKQINLDGTASLNMYELAAMPAQPVGTANNFVTREEFETVIAQLQASLIPATGPVEPAPEPVQPQEVPQPTVTTANQNFKF